MPSQKSPKPAAKAPNELTTDEAIRKLFHPAVVAHAKRHAREASKPKTKADPKSTSGS
jgi:hypothetical protein